MKYFETIKRYFQKSDNVKKRESSVRYVGQSKPRYSSISNPSLAMTNSVIFRGITILSDSVASIPLYVYRLNKDGYWEIDAKNPLHNVFTRKANQRQTVYEFLEDTIIQMYLYGNAYIYIKRNATGDITELIPCYPQTVCFDAVNNTYTITDVYNKINGTFQPHTIIHLRGKSLENIVGKSVAAYCAKTIGLSYAVDEESLNIMQTGGRLKGIVTTQSQVTGFGEYQDNQLADVTGNLEDELASGKDFLSMPSGTEFKPISQSTKDLMLNDTKQYTLSDLARFVGISLSKLYIAFGSNYQVALSENINYFVDTLNPLLRKIEKALNCALIPSTVANRYKIEFDRTTLPYYADVLANYQKQIELGILSVNQLRKIHNQLPVEGGDNVVISTNLQSVQNPTVVADELQSADTEAVKEDNKQFEQVENNK